MALLGLFPLQVLILFACHRWNTRRLTGNGAAPRSAQVIEMVSDDSQRAFVPVTGIPIAVVSGVPCRQGACSTGSSHVSTVSTVSTGIPIALPIP
jgi:hypothetical protein